MGQPCGQKSQIYFEENLQLFTWPLDPTDKTTIDAETTIKSTNQIKNYVIS